jgi:hypothetical protein
MAEDAGKIDQEDGLDFEGPDAEEVYSNLINLLISRPAPNLIAIWIVCSECDVNQITKLKCSQCEFLKFKNIDQWTNHVVGHWRLAGMTPDYEVNS